MTEINNKGVLVDLMDNLRDYGYIPVGKIKQDIELDSCYSVSLEDEDREFAPISISIINENTGEPGMIIKTAVEIFPFTDFNKLLDMINTLNNQLSLTKVTLEGHGDDNYYLAMSIVQMFDGLETAKIHDIVLDNIGSWKGLISYLIKNNYIVTTDDIMARFA